jgi:hypothetical protein
MSSSTTSTKTPDGRYELFHRIKDSWGDFSCNEHHWRLVDTKSGETIARWIDEGGDGIDGISFSEDHRFVVIKLSNGSNERFSLPE